MVYRFVFFTGLFLSLLAPNNARANITLLDKDDWKFLFGGFIESDLIYDSTRSFTETVGNNPVVRQGTANGNGDNGRTQFSMRNTRFSFTALPPVTNGYKTKAYLEFDFQGYDPAPSGTGTTNSEASFFSSPTVRMRQGYLSTESEGWQFLAGQTWTLFGWDPNYVLATISVSPVAGTIYQRTPQLTALKSAPLGDDFAYVAGVSVARPTQRDSDAPNLDAGIKFQGLQRKSGFSSASGELTSEPMSLALSGTFRQFLTPTPGGGPGDTTRYYGGALAIDALVPIISSSDGKETSQTLTLTAEFTSGTGYGDELTGWTGNVPQLPTGTTAPQSTTNLDGGLGGFDSSGNFQLVKLQSFNTQLQYHLPETWHSFVTGGYGQLASFNPTLFTPLNGGVLYDRAEVYFLNFFHDFSSQIRLALEFDRFGTHYTDGVFAFDSRVQFSAWFRF